MLTDTEKSIILKKTSKEIIKIIDKNILNKNNIDTDDKLDCVSKLLISLIVNHIHAINECTNSTLEKCLNIHINSIVDIANLFASFKGMH